MIDNRRNQISQLQRQFRRRRKPEILAAGQRTGIFESKDAKAFIFEDLNKRRGRFDQCTKDELAVVFFNAGVTEWTMKK